jgi:hypothetical protein
MRRSRHRWLLFAMLLLAGCASSSQLARQSEDALEKGDMRKAYEKARRALDKDPGNGAAQSAFANAATQLSDDYKARVMRLAEVDTIAAARMALDFKAARMEFARYPVTLPEDPPYRDHEARVVDAAARIRYREAGQSLADGRPKEATRRYEECAEFVPGYRDVDRKALEAMELAIARVAVMPFDNQVDVPGLGHGVSGRIGEELMRRAGSPAFRFTRALPPAELDEKLTVAQARGLARDQAVALGRRLGVQRVVCGRLSGMRMNTTTDDVTQPIYRRVLEKQPDGGTEERWERIDLRVIDRLRTMDMSCAYEVVDVKSGAIVASGSVPAQAAARIVWSDYVARDDCDDYALVTPAMRQADARAADARVKDWKERYGDRTLPKFLETVREQRDKRTRYHSRYRDEFYPDTRSRPVFMGELPDEDEMAWVALRDAWKPVIEALRGLDPVD